MTLFNYITKRIDEIENCELAVNGSLPCYTSEELKDLLCNLKKEWCSLEEVPVREEDDHEYVDSISRQAAIDTEGLDAQIRCEMCRNPMHTDRGCDGNCKCDEKLYERIMQILDERIKPLPSVQPEPKWIPVTKKAHPDLPIRVQVQMDNGWIITAYYQEGEWLSVPDCGESLKDEWVEAWRELPEPYEERRATQESQSDAIDECQNCESYLRLKNGIHAMCLKEEVWDFCSRLEKEDKEKWEE